MTKIIKVKVKDSPKYNIQEETPKVLSDTFYKHLSKLPYKTFEKFTEDLLISFIALKILDEDSAYMKETYLEGVFTAQVSANTKSTVHFSIDLSDYYNEYVSLVTERNYPEDVAFSMCSLRIYGRLEQVYNRLYDMHHIIKKGWWFN